MNSTADNASAGKNHHLNSMADKASTNQNNHMNITAHKAGKPIFVSNDCNNMPITKVIMHRPIKDESRGINTNNLIEIKPTKNLFKTGQ